MASAIDDCQCLKGVVEPSEGSYITLKYTCFSGTHRRHFDSIQTKDHLKQMARRYTGSCRHFEFPFAKSGTSLQMMTSSHHSSAADDNMGTNIKNATTKDIFASSHFSSLQIIQTIRSEPVTAFFSMLETQLHQPCS